METTIKNFKLTSVFKGEKAANWGNGDNWNHHIVTVVNADNKKRTSFDFWGSVVNPEIQTERQLIEAFNCFVSDAMSGQNSFEDFCGEFGYDTDSRKAEKIWKACKKSFDKLQRIAPSVDVYELWDEINNAETVTA